MPLKFQEQWEVRPDNRPVNRTITGLIPRSVGRVSPSEPGSDRPTPGPNPLEDSENKHEGCGCCVEDSVESKTDSRPFDGWRKRHVSISRRNLVEGATYEPLNLLREALKSASPSCSRWELAWPHHVHDASLADFREPSARSAPEKRRAKSLQVPRKARPSQRGDGRRSRQREARLPKRRSPPPFRGRAKFPGANRVSNVLHGRFVTLSKLELLKNFYLPNYGGKRPCDPHEHAS